MINKNKNLVFAIFQVKILNFEVFNNSQKVTIMSHVSSFYQNWFSKKIVTRYYWPILDLKNFIFINVTFSENLKSRVS